MIAQKIIWWVRELLTRADNINDIGAVLIDMLATANTELVRRSED